MMPPFLFLNIQIGVKGCSLNCPDSENVFWSHAYQLILWCAQSNKLRWVLDFQFLSGLFAAERV